MSALSLATTGVARRAGAVDAIVSSLPVSLTFGRGFVDLIAVDGAPGWNDEVLRARDAGARGVLVVGPVAPESRGLSNVGLPVVLDRSFAGNPGLDNVTAELTGFDARALLEVRVVVPTGADLQETLLDQLALVRAVDSAVDSAALVLRSTHGYTVRGRLDSGRAVLLTATVTDALPRSASLRAVGSDSIIDALIPSPAAARPLRMTVTTASGETLLPTRFETSHRHDWRRLIDLVNSERSSSDLEDFERDIGIVASLTPLHH